MVYPTRPLDKHNKESLFMWTSMLQPKLLLKRSYHQFWLFLLYWGKHWLLSSLNAQFDFHVKHEFLEAFEWNNSKQGIHQDKFLVSCSFQSLLTSPRLLRIQAQYKGTTKSHHRMLLCIRWHSCDQLKQEYVLHWVHFIIPSMLMVWKDTFSMHRQAHHIYERPYTPFQRIQHLSLKGLT